MPLRTKLEQNSNKTKLTFLVGPSVGTDVGLSLQINGLRVGPHGPSGNPRPATQMHASYSENDPPVDNCSHKIPPPQV